MCSDCCNLWITNALIAHSHAHACTHVDRWVSDATRQIATHLANAILDVAQTKRRVPLCVYSSLLRSSMLCRLSLSLLFISSRSFLVLHPPSYFTQSTSCTSSFLIFLLTLFIVGSLSGFGVVLLVVQYIYAIATIIKHAQMMSDPIDYHSSGYDLDPERNFAAIKTRMGRNTAPKQQPNLSSSPPRGSLSEPPSPCLLPQSQLNSEPPSPSLVAAVRANETSDMANNASDASRGTMPVMHDDADQGRCFGSDDTRSDFSSSAIQYSYTALSTPVSRKSMASETTSTPASTPFRSVERPKTLAILKTQVTETGRPANPIFSLDLEASPMSLDDQSHFGDFDASDNTNSGCWTPNPKSDDAESIRSDSTLSPKAVLNLSSAAESDVHMTNVDAIDRSHPSACLFVASLSSAHTLESLRIAVMNVFAKWNPLDVTAHRDSSDRPYAFVQLRSYEDARDALRECRGALIFDRPIRCEHARVNRALFLASASRHLLRRDAENIFKKFGQLEFLISATIQYGRGNVRGWCAKFEYREDAIEAYFNLKPNEDCIIFYVQNPDPRIPTSMDNPSIFIRNLDAKRVTTELLQSRFATYGRIIDIELLNRSSSDSPAETVCALIKFTTMDEARNAIIQENKTLLLDRRIYICFGNMNKIPTAVKLAPAPKTNEASGKLSQTQAAFSNPVTLQTGQIQQQFFVPGSYRGSKSVLSDTTNSFNNHQGSSNTKSVLPLFAADVSMYPTVTAYGPNADGQYIYDHAYIDPTTGYISGFPPSYGQSVGNGMYAATPEQLYAYHSYMMAQSMTTGMENNVPYMENLPYGYYQYAFPYQMYVPPANGLATVDHNPASDSNGDSLKHPDMPRGFQQNNAQQKTAGSSHSGQSKTPQKSPTFPAMAFPQSYPDSQGVQKPYNYDGQIYYPPLAYQISAYSGQSGSYPYPAMSYGDNYSRENYFDSNAYNGQVGSVSVPMANTSRGYTPGHLTHGKHQGGARSRAFSAAQRSGIDKSG